MWFWPIPTASFPMTWLKGQHPPVTTPNTCVGKVTSGSGTCMLLWHCPNRLYILTVLQATCSQFVLWKHFFWTSKHPYYYFEYFELEKHSYKMNTDMSCYPLRIIFFSKYLQWDVGRIVSSGQIINQPSASMGTRKDPNSEEESC